MMFADSHLTGKEESVGSNQTREYSQLCDENECFEQLLLLARRRTGAIPEETVVQYVLQITPQEQGADWSLRHAALEALLRRHDSAHKEELRLQTPLKSPFLGTYATGTKGKRGSPRPYSTVMWSVAPPAGSCDCPDFGKNSLGLCKHLFVGLEFVYARAERLRAALREQTRRAAQPAQRLWYHPIRPLAGPGDFLHQVRWNPDTSQARVPTALTTRLRRYFAPAPRSPESYLVLQETWPQEPRRRLALVEDLACLLETLHEQHAARKPNDYAEPALHALLAMERARLQRQCDGQALADRLPSLLKELKLPLYPYQVAGVQRFLSSGGRLLLGDDMGLGKTAQAIAACHALWTAGKVRKGLIAVPASLKAQWLREWLLFSAAPVAMVEGAPAERAHIYQKTAAGFLIVSYEQVLRDLPLLQAFAPELVVLDEAQRIKNWATKTALYIKTLQVPYRLVLTGTPLENRLDELASLVEWVDSLAIEPKWRLGPWHAQSSDAGVIGARHLDTLRQRLSGCMLRRVRKDVLRQLPARTDTRVPIEMTPQQREEHEALNVPIAQLLAILRKRPLSPAQHLRLMSLLATQRIICNGLAQLRFIEVWPMVRGLSSVDQTVRDGLFSPKLSVLRELITQLVVNQGRKVVVFSQWRRMLQLSEWAVRDVLAAVGARAMFFTGGQSQARRTQALVEFHDQPAVPVLFLSDAGGVGLNLQHAASACINLELPWNPAVLEQRIGRIYRLGQKQPIDVYNLITTEGIEARITDLVGNKKALFTGLFDGTTDEIRFERSGSLLSRIEQLIAPATELLESGSLPDADPESAEAPAAGQQLDELLATADESQDTQEVPAENEVGPQAEAVPEILTRSQLAESPEAAPISFASESATEPAEESANLNQNRAPAPGSGAAAQLPPLSVEALRSLLTEVAIHPGVGGGLSIEATPAAASTLATLLSSLAGMLLAASPRDAGRPRGPADVERQEGGS